MALPTDKPRAAALLLLSSLVPRSVMERARDIAHQFESEERTREYLAKRWIFVLFVTFASVVTSILVTAGLVGLTGMWLAPAWLKTGVFFSVIVVWIIGIFAPVYFLYRWAEAKTAPPSSFPGVLAGDNRDPVQPHAVEYHCADARAAQRANLLSVLPADNRELPRFNSIKATADPLPPRPRRSLIPLIIAFMVTAAIITTLALCPPFVTGMLIGLVLLAPIVFHLFGR